VQKLTGALCVVVLAAAQSLPKPVPLPADFAREADEVFAAISDAQFPGHCDKVEPNEYVAVNRSVLSVPDNDTVKQVHPTSTEEREMIRHLVELGKKSYLWPFDAKFGSRSHVLKAGEDVVITRCLDRRWRGKPMDGECAAYPGLHFVRSYSLPSFNAGHTRVLIFTQRICGPFLCGGDEFQEYRKIGEKWTRQNGFAGGCMIY
jgi:hypothetical protein